MNELQEREFDLQLSKALHRVDAPPNFANAVMVAVEVDKAVNGKAKVLAFPKPRPWMSAAIAAALIVSVFTGQQVHKKHQRDVADQQFETAARITDRALQETREQLQRAGVPVD
jgi:hypothetical protein